MLFKKSLLKNRCTVICACLLLVACVVQEDKAKTYTPLKFDGIKGFIVVEGLVNKQHYDRVEQVLSHYDISYTRSGETQIKFKEPLTKDLISNFREKAEDPVWGKRL